MSRKNLGFLAKRINDNLAIPVRHIMSYDCRLFSIAYATALAHVVDPAVYCSIKMSFVVTTVAHIMA